MWYVLLYSLHALDKKKFDFSQKYIPFLRQIVTLEMLEGSITNKKERKKERKRNRKFFFKENDEGRTGGLKVYFAIGKSP